MKPSPLKKMHSLDEYAEIYGSLKDRGRDLVWQLCEIVGQVETTYGESSLREFANHPRVHEKFKRLYTYRNVWKTYGAWITEHPEAKEYIAFSLFEVAVYAPKDFDKVALLEEAHDKDWKIIDLKEHIYGKHREANGEEPHTVYVYVRPGHWADVKSSVLALEEEGHITKWRRI